MQLGQMIAKIRKEEGLTQETFAKKFNVTRQTVSNWENEKSYPDLHTLVNISDTFHISLDVLLKGDTAMVKDIDKKIKKHSLYKGLMIGLVILVAILTILLSVIYFTDKSLNDTVKEHMAWNVSSVEAIEIYDFSSQELITKAEDSGSVNRVLSGLNIQGWEKTGKIDSDSKPAYTIKLYHDTGKQGNGIGAEEITVYEDGGYAAVFITSPGNVKQNYKTEINISELINE